MGENEEPREDEENDPENSGDGLNWLDQLASGAGSIWDDPEATGDPTTDEIPQQSTEDEIPDWLRADLEKEVPIDEDVPEWLVSDIEVDGAPQKGEDAPEQLEYPPEPEAEHPEDPADDARTVLFQSEEAFVEEPKKEAEEEIAAENELNWLEEIAAGEGASIEEPLTMNWDDIEPEETDASSELEADSLTWIGDLETMPELDLVADEDRQDGQTPDETARVEDHLEAVIEEPEVEGREVLYDEVPDDPDEAMAWLEQLAAKQGAPMEELPSMHVDLAEDETNVVPIVDSSDEDGDALPIESLAPESLVDASVEDSSAEMGEKIDRPDIEDTLIYGLTGFTADDVIRQAGQESAVEPELVAQDIPEDPDEAMIWIEELSARQSASTAELNAENQEILVEGDELQLEGEHEVIPEDVSPAFDDFGTYGELDEALSWLEEIVDLDEGDPAEPVEIIEEPPTPHVVRDVSMAIEEASQLEPEAGDPGQDVPEVVVPAEDVEATDDTAEAFAWLDHLAESGSDLPDDLVAPDMEDQVALESDDLVPPAAEAEGEVEESEEVLEMPTMESREPVFESLEDPLEVHVNEEGIDNELAWLDTLGAVRAEEWLAAEEQVSDQEPEPIVASAEEIEEAPMGREEVVFERESLEDEVTDAIDDALAPEEILKDSEQVQLQTARSALASGSVLQALEQYETLLADDSSIPFVISDLEASLDRDGDQPLVQRTLGDAFVRNGQLKKALEVYRQALDTL